MQVEINIQLTAIETFDEDDIIDLLHSVIKQQATISESKKFTTEDEKTEDKYDCLLYTSPSPRDGLLSRMPSSA